VTAAAEAEQGVTVAHLWTNGRQRADNMQGGGSLIYPCNRRTDEAAWVAAHACGEWDSSVWRQSGRVGVRSHDAEAHRQWVL
jgi:hypothetical protein